jgi:catechol-2,3-dioxygenase
MGHDSRAGALGARRTIMIQAKRLGHVVLNVRDAAKSREFYTRTLGLQVAHEDLERGTVFLSFGREHHDLAPVPDGDR